MQAVFRHLRVSRQWVHASSQILGQLPSIHYVPCLLAKQSRKQSQQLSTSSSTASTVCVEPDTDVEAAVAAALATTGRTPGPAEAQLVSGEAFCLTAVVLHGLPA
jgi:hypothetical protein